MKTLLVLYNDSDWHHDIPFNSEYYNNNDLRFAYGQLAKALQKHNIKLARASHEWYKGRGLFKKAWVFNNNRWEKKENIKADAIFDKTPSAKEFMSKKRLIKRSIPVFNNPNLDLLCSDKLKTYKLFKNMMPRSYLINNKTELKAKLKHIQTKKIVLKPNTGSSAKGLIITDRNKLPKKIPKDTLLQEFITCKGIPKIVKGVSDFRLVICDGKIITAVIRIAKKGELASNVSRGGKMIFIDFKRIPKVLIRYSKQIDDKLKKYKSRLYTADFVFDQDNVPYLMELNSKPGFFYYKTFNKPKLMRLFLDTVSDSIKKLF